MHDVFGNPVRCGDLCAVSARIGKHDTCIKLFYVVSIHAEQGGNGRDAVEYLRGYDGAGCLTQIQKAHNIVVINGSVNPDHPRLRHIFDRLDPPERTALRQRLTGNVDGNIL